MRSPLLVAILALSLITPTANAAVKIKPSKPICSGSSQTGSGDQISDFAMSKKLVAIAGTVESESTELLDSPPLGGSDGFITAFDKAKNKVWELRLGSEVDDLATAVTSDAAGNFWVAGAASKPIESTVNSSDSSLPIEIDSVTVDTVYAPNNPLTRLVIWKIDSAGLLAATYFQDFSGVIAPNQIRLNGATFEITGTQSANLKSEKFMISVDQEGTFSQTAKVSNKIKKSPEILTIKAGRNNLKSFISKTTIIGIPSWRAKRPTPVIVKYTKSGTALTANSFKGKVKKILWRKGIGAVVLTTVNSENEIHIRSNMA